MRKRIGALLLCICVLCGCTPRQAPLSGSGDTVSAQDPERVPSRDTMSMAQLSEVLQSRNGYFLNAAVLFDGQGADTGWKTTLDYLKQSLTLNLTAQAIDVSRAYTLDGVDLLILDVSVLHTSGLRQLTEAVISYTENGGYVFLPNDFYDTFPMEYLGVSSFEKLTGFPDALTCPAVPEELAELQSLIVDFHSVYTRFADAEALMAMDYGYGMHADSATVLAACGDAALYTLNRYGGGAVLLSNPLLPNGYSKSAFSLAAREGQASFSGTTASCNQLFLSDYAAYVLKQLYGFSMSRVFGAYGTPAMSWELHYEDITSIENDSLGIFTPICKEYRQVPSIALVRNPYTWFEQAETMTYALNQSGGGSLEFEVDRNENAYSSGTHIAAGAAWLQLNALQDCDSYFADLPGENYRLSPCILDYDGDGNLDAFCGSEDGFVYYYHGRGFTGSDGRLSMEGPTVVEGVVVSNFSAPQLLDLDGDGALDILLGGDDGCIYWFKGAGDLRFSPQGILLKTDIQGQCLPAVGDIDGDGVLDLAVGSNQGVLIFYYGEKQGKATAFSYRRMGSMSRQCANEGYGSWLAPNLTDLNGDGVTDLALGTYDGYVAVLHGDGTGHFTFQSYITAEDMNYKGNHNLKFGHYCTPVFCDLDGNGSLDLLCGYEEYGMAYPIDSDYFPFRAELQKQIDDCRENGYYISVHFLTGSYHSAAREAYELGAQLDAFRSYGITSAEGANQHTWHMSEFDEAQSLRSIWDAGLLWESGYAPARASCQTPQTAAENIIALPFYMMDGDERTLLIQNCSVLPYLDDGATSLSGKYGMPVLVYYHCDMIYKSDESAREAVQTVAAFRDAFHYNFVGEDQLMYSIAAAYNLEVDVAATEQGFSITPKAIQTDFPLYDEAAQSAAGIRIDASRAFLDALSTDAAVWYRSDSGLCLGLDRTVTVSGGGSQSASCHIRQVNTPAEITPTENGAVLRFTQGGMQQVVVEGAAGTADAGWDVETKDGMTVFTAYLAAPVLHITYKEAA